MAFKHAIANFNFVFVEDVFVLCSNKVENKVYIQIVAMQR